MEGDLLVVEGHANPHEIGRCAMATDDVQGFAFQNHLFRLRPNRVDPNYGLLWLNSPYVKSYWVREAATSSGLNTINSKKLARVVVALPSKREQQAVVYRVRSLKDRGDMEARSKVVLQDIRTALMSDLLTGQVRVTPLLNSDSDHPLSAIR